MLGQTWGPISAPKLCLSNVSTKLRQSRQSYHSRQLLFLILSFWSKLTDEQWSVAGGQWSAGSKEVFENWIGTSLIVDRSLFVVLLFREFRVFRGYVFLPRITQIPSERGHPCPPWAEGEDVLAANYTNKYEWKRRSNYFFQNSWKKPPLDQRKDRIYSGYGVRLYYDIHRLYVEGR